MIYVDLSQGHILQQLGFLGVLIVLLFIAALIVWLIGVGSWFVGVRWALPLGKYLKNKKPELLKKIFQKELPFYKRNGWIIRRQYNDYIASDKDFSDKTIKYYKIKLRPAIRIFYVSGYVFTALIVLLILIGTFLN